jgi:hypothetical protein|tara:strand:+ start:648 stop:908 length:261 start_codon:yes stop_codon:yes gene_type:complete
MNEYLVTVKDYEGEVLEIKAFAYNLMQVIDNMVSFEFIEAIKSVTRIEDNYIWHFGNSYSVSELREMRKEIGDENIIQNLFKENKD